MTDQLFMFHMLFKKKTGHILAFFNYADGEA